MKPPKLTPVQRAQVLGDPAPAAIIHARYYGGAYIARAAGLNVTASCTGCPEQAAKACARKLEARLGGKIRSMKRYGRSDSWVVEIARPGDLTCPRCGEPFDPETDQVVECPRCGRPGATSCCCTAGVGCICIECEEAGQ